MKTNILLVESDIEISASIVEYMENLGHSVDYAPSARIAKNLFRDNSYDVAIFASQLPGMNGLELCQEVRKEYVSAIPILILTEPGRLESIIAGFKSGADDCLSKPFDMQELYLRIIALSGRNLLNKEYKIVLDPLTIDRRAHQVFRERHAIKCTRKGFDILRILAESYPNVVSRAELLQSLWGGKENRYDALRTHFYQLRSVIDKPFSFPLLKTVHGVGFTLQNIQ